MKHASFAVLVAALGCGGSKSSSKVVSPTPPAPPPGAIVLAHGAGDLDGTPGDEALDLYSDGTLIAGGWSTQVDLASTQAEPNYIKEVAAQRDGEAGMPYFLGEQASLRVEVLDAKAGTRIVVLGLPVQEDEDPPNRWQAYVIDGAGLRRVLDLTAGGYGPGAITFPGDNTARQVQDGWSACGNGGVDEAPILELTFGWKGDALAETARNPTGQVQKCDELSACPWIYVDGPAGPVRVGEILRDVRGRAAYALQDLALPSAAPGQRHVRIAEEENEVTFLDEIYLEVDGVKFAPTACAVDRPPAYCSADHVPLRLDRGDALDLTFDVGVDGAAVVFARGYYVPTPSRK